MKRTTIVTAFATMLLLLASAATARPPSDDGTFALDAPTFDIDATRDGGIAFTQASAVGKINTRNGRIRIINELPLEMTSPATTVNGVEAVGARNFFVTTGGADQAIQTGLWHVNRGKARLLGDIETFETTHDPDAFEGIQWKNQACEEDPVGGFTAGPQSNPYHLVRSGGKFIVADAAGNSLLSVRRNGSIDWLAVFTPPTDQDGDFLVLFPLNDEVDCYVQPVPTSVAIAPNGDYFVGELTGAAADGLPIGLSRVWRIDRGANNVTCPSSQCEVVLDGLTSVIDVEFGPDGKLYVVEYEANSWLAQFVGAPNLGGSVKACDVNTGDCTTVADGLEFPGAITFDKWGTLWLLEDGTGTPTVRSLDY